MGNPVGGNSISEISRFTRGQKISDFWGGISPVGGVRKFIISGGGYPIWGGVKICGGGQTPCAHYAPPPQVKKFVLEYNT